MRRIWLGMLTALIALAPLPALACSVVPEYRVPTNFELVQEADVIAVVRITSGPAAYSGGTDTPKVRVTPMLFLKGSAGAGEMGLEGVTAWQGVPVRPFVTTLSEAHYSAFFGGCVRAFYPVGGYALALYKRDGSKLAPLWYPFARAVEDVAGVSDLWVRVARRYVALAAGDPETLTGRVAAELAGLVTRTDMESQAMAVDLSRFLSRDGRSEPIPTWSMWSYREDEAVATAPLIADDDYALVSIQCSRSRSPALNYSPANSGPLALRVDDRVFETQRGKPLNGLANGTVGDFTDPRGLLQALAVTTRPVTVLANGRVLRVGLPADTFFRWVARCRALRGYRAR